MAGLPPHRWILGPPCTLCSPPPPPTPSVAGPPPKSYKGKYNHQTHQFTFHFVLLPFLFFLFLLSLPPFFSFLFWMGLTRPDSPLPLDPLMPVSSGLDRCSRPRATLSNVRIEGNNCDNYSKKPHQVSFYFFFNPEMCPTLGLSSESAAHLYGRR